MTLFCALSNDLDNVRVDLSAVSGVEPIPLVKGYYLKPTNSVIDIDNPVVSNNGWAYGLVECQPEDKFVVNGESYNGAYPRAWYFLDVNKTILNEAKKGITVENVMLSAPSGARYFVVHIKSPYTPSYKGITAKAETQKVSTDLMLYKEGLEQLEYGTINDTTGLTGVEQPTNRIRTSGFIPLEQYYGFRVPASVNNINIRLYPYCYNADFTYIGHAATGKTFISTRDLIETYTGVKYVKFVIRDVNSVGELADLLDEIQTGFELLRRGRIPSLTDAQKAQIKDLAGDYLENVGNFLYYTSATINDYASQSNAFRQGKYKICCSLLAQMLWMGRSISDFASLENYSNSVTKAFDWGYNFQFPERPLYSLKPSDGYYGWVNPFDDENYAGSYSWNTYYSPGSSRQYKQAYNTFLYANDMAKEMDYSGFAIPASELEIGDLIFSVYPTYDPQKDTFTAIAYKHINHVSMVYDKGENYIAIIESTPRFADAIHLSRSNGSDEEKVRVSYILANAVGFARHPAAFGKGGNVPAEITAL